MAKRKSLNKRFSRYSRSNGSDVLNPDTNVLDDEQPYWWRKLENNTIARPSIDSANFNQTSRRLDSNFSIRTSNDLDDDWWKVLERTPHNLKPLQKSNDLSKKDANNGTPGTSESEEEVKITKKKPPLRSEVKKVDGNAFLSALNESKVLLIPLEKDPAIQRSSFVERFVSTSGISNDSKQLNKDNDMEPRMTEISHLSNSTLPKATSTPVESSIVFQHTNVGNSSSDIEPVVKKPKSKLLKRHNRDMKKNLFENILMEDKIDEEEATDRPISNANAMMDNSAEEPESRIGEDESTLEDANANKRLQPTEKTNFQNSENDFSDTSEAFLQPAKPKSRFLRQTRTSIRENLFQRILEDNDSWITKAVSNLSQNSTSTGTMRRLSVISAESNDCTEDMHLRLSNSSNASDVDIIRTDNNKISSSRNSHVEIASSQPEDRISNAMKTSRERSVLSNENENENDKDSDVTLLTPASESPSMQSRSTVPSDIIPLQSEACARQQCQKNSGADKEPVASLRKGSVEIKDLADAENIDDASDIEFRDLNTSRKRLTPCSAQEIAVEETAITQQTIKSQDHSGVATFNGERTEHDEEAASRRSRSLSRLRKASVSRAGNVSEAEQSAQTPSRRQSNRLNTSRQRISFFANDEKICEFDNTTPKQSKRSEAARRSSETEIVRTPIRESRNAKRSVSHTINEAESEVAKSPLTRSKTLKQVLPPVKENAPVEIENVTPRASQRLSRTRKGVSQTLASHPDVECSQSPATRQSKALDQVAMSPVKESELEGILQSQRSSTTKMEMSLMAASESGANNSNVQTPKRYSKAGKRSVPRTVSENEMDATESPARKQSKRVSTMQEQIVSIAAIENKPNQVEDTATKRRPSLSKIQKEAAMIFASKSEIPDEQFPIEKESNTQKHMEPADGKDTSPRQSQRLGRVRKGRSLAISSESEIESTQSPPRKGRGRTNNTQKQMDLPNADDTSPRASQRLSRVRKGRSLAISSESEIESTQSPSTKGRKRTSNTQKQMDTANADDTSPRASQRLSTVRKGRSLAITSESEIESTQSPSRKGRGRTTNTQKQMDPVNADDTSPRASQRLSRVRKGRSLAISSEFEIESTQSPSTKGSGRTSNTQKQIDAANADDTSPRARQRLSRVRKGRSLAISSESEIESTQSPSRKGKGRTSNTQKQMDLPNADDTSPRVSQRLSRVRKGRSLAISSEFEIESTQSPSTKGRGRTSNTQKQIDTANADDTSPRASQRLSRVHKGRSLAISSESEIESTQSPSRKGKGRTSNTQKQMDPVNADDTSPRASQRLSTVRKGRSLAISSKSEIESTQSPSRKGRGRTSNTQKQMDPVNADDTSPRASQRLSRVRKGRSLAISSESEIESTQSPSRKERGRTSNTQKQMDPVNADDTSPRASQRLSRVRQGRSLAITSESEIESTQSPLTKGRGRTSNAQKQMDPANADDTSPRASQRLSRVHKGHSMVISSESEDEGSQSLSEMGGGRTSKVQEQVDSIEAEDTVPRPSQKLVETSKVSSLYRPGPGKVKSSMATQESHKGQRNIQDFFKTRVNATPASQALSNPLIAQEIRKKLDEIKKQELERIEEVRKLPVVGERNKFGKGTRPQPKRQNSVPRKVDKAYMVNGLVYKPPRLPRPKKWVTDHLYRHLWKQMEPKFKLETRVQSEKFVSRLSEVTDVIAKRKTYPFYKNELHALMKEMARLQIIRNRHDFYNFCHEFLPYELRVKMVPILLPGNRRTIPYDPEKLYQPLLSP